MKFKFLKFSGLKLAGLLTAGVLAVFVMDRMMNAPWTEFFQLMEFKAYDFRFKALGTRRPPDQIGILAIDEKSIDELGRFPWDRKVLAQGLDNLRKDGAAVVAWDVVFSEVDPADKHIEAMAKMARRYEDAGLKEAKVLPENFQETLGDAAARLKGGDAALRRKLDEISKQAAEAQSAAMGKSGEFYATLKEASTGGNDAALARAYKEFSGNVGGYFFYLQESEVQGLKESDYKVSSDFIAPARIKVVTERGSTPEPEPFYNIRAPLGLKPNIVQLSQASRYQGYFNAELDLDGVIRRTPLVLRYGEDLYPSLALEAVVAYRQRSAPDAEIAVTYEHGIGVTEMRLDDTALPVNEEGHLLVNYYGPQKQFPHYSFADVYRGNFKPGTFKDKILFVGSTAIAVYDLRTTPFEKAYPGVETHATIAANILSGQFMEAADGLRLVEEVLLIIVLGIFLGFFVSRIRALLGAAITAAMIVGLFAFNFFLFRQGVWLNIVYPALELIVVYTGITVYRYATEEKEKKQIKNAFGLYLHPAMVEKVAEHPDSLRLGGERLNLTAFFSDIEGFSTFSEKMQPEELVHFLNEYLTEMTDIAQGHEATVDKYIGDAIVSFYGAPLHYPDHAVKACYSALDMQARLAVLREGWLTKGLPQVRMRIGLNTGPMVVGNMGSHKRFNYTMMGDAVNLAARLESQCKAYGIYIMVGEETEKEARDFIETRFMDNLVVKGKTKPAQVFELLGRKGQLSGKWPEILGVWNQAMEAYRKQQFDLALRYFSNVLELRPDDKPSKVFIGRCEEFKAAPPSSDWDGAYHAKEK